MRNSWAGFVVSRTSRFTSPGAVRQPSGVGVGVGGTGLGVRVNVGMGVGGIADWVRDFAFADEQAESPTRNEKYAIKNIA